MVLKRCNTGKIVGPGNGTEKYNFLIQQNANTVSSVKLNKFLFPIRVLAFMANICLSN